MESSLKCDICKIDVQGASFAKHLKSKKHLEKIKQKVMSIPDWLFEEINENAINIPRRICNPTILKQIAREILKDLINKEN